MRIRRISVFHTHRHFVVGGDEFFLHLRQSDPEGRRTRSAHRKRISYDRGQSGESYDLRARDSLLRIGGMGNVTYYRNHNRDAYHVPAAFSPNRSGLLHAPEAEAASLRSSAQIGAKRSGFVIFVFIGNLFRRSVMARRQAGVLRIDPR